MIYLVGANEVEMEEREAPNKPNSHKCVCHQNHGSWRFGHSLPNTEGIPCLLISVHHKFDVQC